MRNVPIPRHIDAIPQIFFWELDEFLILASVFGVGIAIGGIYTLGGIILGFLAANKFKTYKSNGLPGQLNHIFHWRNVMNLNSAYPNGGKRRIFK